MNLLCNFLNLLIYSPFYKYPIPEEYLEILRFSDGAYLYNAKIRSEQDPDLWYSSCSLCIYGLPLAPPTGNPEQPEPGDVRIEGLSRHEELPESWFKCGHYDSRDEVRHDIFTDSITGKTYFCIKNEKHIEKEWENLDQCLCEIFEMLRDTPSEYIVQFRDFQETEYPDEKHILSKTRVKKLFSYLRRQLKKEACDQTLRFTEQWIKENIPLKKQKAVMEELENMGGYCDCEVLGNCYGDYFE